MTKAGQTCTEAARYMNSGQTAELRTSLSSPTTTAETRSYDHNGQLTGVNQANGAVATLAWNNDSTLANLTLAQRGNTLDRGPELRTYFDTRCLLDLGARMIGLVGHRLLVTGGGSGIGRAIALGACRAGAQVVVAGRRPDVLAEVVGAAGPESPGDPRDSGRGSIQAIPADVASTASVRSLVATTVEVLGGLDGVVNAAGVHSLGASEDLEDAELERVLQVNLVGAFRVAREAGRVMLRGGAGSIVQVASLSSFGSFPGRLAYAVSKAGVVELTETLSAEWGRRGVRVNAVVPGFVRTPISDALVARGELDLEALQARIPMGRRAEPEDIVEPTLFLLSDAARYISGHCLVVDGGWLPFVGPVDRWLNPVDASD